MTKIIGTLAYMPPEQLRKSYNEKCDMWSIGVTAFKLLSGYLPFQGELDADIERNIMKAKFNFK